ncbi:sugar MFS transporter [Capnocytophaga canis]|uniref:Glucose/galactose transporter n=1 Tax=Capnocytophaga canis TaxID=1848903 RepID=A0A0B7IU15_9FLAO|nr:sugar MFS transporter [Capnocytophaga canis]RIY37005.1 sugar MFS transporter [Capnocytophaga canis]GIM62097.1 sugar transporter [Capnocytophaga canis]CEN53448.1 Glucose/galactose transporter [Capnocytophaga canis]
MSTKQNYKKAFIFVTALFFLWGFLTVLIDSLIPRLRDVFTLNYFQAGLVQFAFFTAYLLLSIPAGIILSKIGYKRGIILGLLTMATGCFLFYPAASERILGVFLLAVFILASGITFLQVAANPYVSILGDESGASSRLNLSQAFNSLGTTIAPIIGAVFILSDRVKTEEEIAVLSSVEKEAYYLTEAASVQTPFIWIASCIIILATVFAFVKLPEVISLDAKRHSYGELFKKRGLMLGAIGIFLYVGAEVAIGSYLVNYFIDINIVRDILENSTMRSLVSGMGGLLGKADLIHGDPKSIVGIFVMFYWGGAMIGRFIGAYLTQKIAPSKVLIAFSLIAILLILISINTDGLLSMWSILAVGLFNSIMFPTIFTLASEGLSDLRPQASGILCTMIFGGAIIPPVIGFFTDNIGFRMAFLTLVVCYGYILFFGYYKRYHVE